MSPQPRGAGSRSRSAPPAVVVDRSDNPYIGPRPFRRGETLPNRDRTAQQLADLVIAEKVVLLHAPSGAGKTSLIQAAVRPLLAAEGFAPTRTIRLGRSAAWSTPPNRYVHSAALELLTADHEEGRDPDPALAPGPTTEADLGRLTLPEIVHALDLPSTRRVLIIDQLEELLTLDPTDVDAKTELFRQLGRVLRDDRCWGLLAIREDFMGGLDPFLRHLPGHLDSRFRLDYLDHGEALAAVLRPAAARGVTVDEAHAHLLVERLADVPVPRVNGGTEHRRSPTIEPFQLQVVCRQLWEEVRGDRGERFASIGRAEVERVSIRGALAQYYRQTMTEIGRRYAVDPRVVRDWCEDELTTPQGLRRQTMHLPQVGDPADEVVQLLMDAYLVRADSRAGTWYELTHDRVVRAVREDNDRWRIQHLAGWQRAAYEWHRKGYQEQFLLSASGLRGAPSPSSANLTDLERRFLRLSRQEARDSGQRPPTFLLRALPVVCALAVLEAVVIAVLIVLVTR